MSPSPDQLTQSVSPADQIMVRSAPEAQRALPRSMRDILSLEPDHQTALRLLGLAITDQFTGGTSDRYGEAEHIFRSLTNDYDRAYYSGILHERKAKAQLRAGRPPHTVTPSFEAALKCFEEAEKIRPPDNDDAILRWNRCVRLLQSRLGTEWRKEMDEFDASEGPPV